MTSVFTGGTRLVRERAYYSRFIRNTPTSILALTSCPRSRKVCKEASCFRPCVFIGARRWLAESKSLEIWAFL